MSYFTTHAEYTERKKCIPVDPHADLRAEYAKQGIEGTTGFYLWEYKNNYMSDWRICNDEIHWLNDEYRCTDISCYVSKDDEVVATRMLRTEAQELQRQTKDTHAWFNPSGGSNCYLFAAGGTYTYRTKATIKLDGRMVTPEQAAAEWEAKKETCAVWYRSDNFLEWGIQKPFSGKYTHDWNKQTQVNGAEYEIRPKQVSWTGSREDIIALLKELGVLK
jgi:hypothetical protein